MDLLSVPRGGLWYCFVFFVPDLGILLLEHDHDCVDQSLSCHSAIRILRSIVEMLLELLGKVIVEVVIFFLSAFDSAKKTFKRHRLIVFLSVRLREILVENLDRRAPIRILHNHVLSFLLLFWCLGIFSIVSWGRFGGSCVSWSLIFGILFSRILFIGRLLIFLRFLVCASDVINFIVRILTIFSVDRLHGISMLILLRILYLVHHCLEHGFCFGILVAIVT